MQAAFTNAYGAPEILEIRETPTPRPGARDLRVEVHATAVSAGDLRVRAADFPAVTAIPGRLMLGLLRPNNPVQGTMFAGVVVEVGDEVEGFEVGDTVFGNVDAGGYAEQLVIPFDGAVAHLPAGWSMEEAAATPYGAGTALHFLRDLAEVQRGERVLVLGASGGVGRYAVQIARHLGAHVTAVCGPDAVELVRNLGADEVIDYRTTDFRESGTRYDVIFDIADAASFRDVRDSLTPTGRYLTLYMTLTVLAQMLLNGLRGGQKALFSIAMGSAESMQDLKELMDAGAVRPTVAASFPLARIVDAHELAESRSVHGEILVLPVAPAALRAVG